MLTVALTLLALWLFGNVVLLVFAGILLAILLAAPVRWLSERSGIGEGWCLAGVIAATLLILVGLGFALAPQVTTQIEEVSSQLPQALQGVLAALRSTMIGKSLLGHLAGGGGQSLGALAEPILKSVSSLTTAIGSIVFVVFIGVYLAATPGHYRRAVLRLVPPERAARVQEILQATGSTLKYFLYGRLLSMSVIGACSTLGLWTIGVPAPVALGLLAGVLSFVPYVGSVASGVPPFLLAFMQRPILGLWVILLYLGIHVLEGYILVPLVQRRMVHMLPALTLTAQLVLGILWGLLGLAMATPIAAALMTLVEMGYVQDVLHKEPRAAAGGRGRGARS
jgi:predicted PurR-regulated permease PerM